MKIVKEVGFDGVELNSGIPNRDDMKKAIEGAGLSVSEIVDSLQLETSRSPARADKVREEGQAGLKTSLEEAKFFRRDTAFCSCRRLSIKPPVTTTLIRAARPRSGKRCPMRKRSTSNRG